MTTIRAPGQYHDTWMMRLAQANPAGQRIMVRQIKKKLCAYTNKTEDVFYAGRVKSARIDNDGGVWVRITTGVRKKTTPEVMLGVDAWLLHGQDARNWVGFALEVEENRWWPRYRAEVNAGRTPEQAVESANNFTRAQAQVEADEGAAEGLDDYHTSDESSAGEGQ